MFMKVKEEYEDLLNKIEAIKHYETEQELYSILSEECAELIHAAQKVRRVICQTTKEVTFNQALMHFYEEVGDVLATLDVILSDCCIEEKVLIEQNISSKIDRWFDRVNMRKAND